MATPFKTCKACDGEGWYPCDCHPADCICAVGPDITCEECAGEGTIDVYFDYDDCVPERDYPNGESDK